MDLGKGKGNSDCSMEGTSSLLAGGLPTSQRALPQITACDKSQETHPCLVVCVLCTMTWGVQKKRGDFLKLPKKKGFKIVADDTELLAQSTGVSLDSFKVWYNLGFVSLLHSDSCVALNGSGVLEENNISSAIFVFNFSTSCLHSSPALLFFCNLRLGALMLCHSLVKKCVICMALLLFSMNYPQLPKLVQKLNCRGFPLFLKWLYIFSFF